MNTAETLKSLLCDLTTAFVVSASALCMTLAFAGSAHAQTAEFTGAVDNNWFNANNWNPVGVPTSGIDTNIIGGFGVTALAADTGGSVIMVDELNVGNDTGGAPLDSLFSEVNILGDNDFAIGVSRSVAGLSLGQIDLMGASIFFPTASEEMEIGVASNGADRLAEGVVNITNGSIIGVEDLTVGQNFQSGGDATGSLTVLNGNILGSDQGNASDFILGSSRGVGVATGSVRVENGSLRGFGFIKIGTDSGNGAGNATLTLVNGVAEFDRTNFFRFAQNSNSVAGSSALLELDTSFLAAGDANIGDGATISMTLDGLTRAADGGVGAGTYSAIDFASADINDATLEINFTFAPSIGDTFDLISLDQGGVFTGSLFDTINVTGSSLDWQTEVIAGTAMSGEIFRLSVPPLPGDFDLDFDVDGNDFLKWQLDPTIGSLADWESNYGTPAPLIAASAVVPEPGSLLLACLAVGALLQRRRRI